MLPNTAWTNHITSFLLQTKSYNLLLFSDIAAHDSSDRKWYLSRIRDDRCKIIQFDQNGFFEYPKPFNNDCFTQVELITAIFTLLARASTIFFLDKMALFMRIQWNLIVTAMWQA